MHSQLSMPMPETVQSVVRCATNGPLLAAAAQLWIGPDDVVLDVTYGRGMFWTHYRPEHLVAHDLALDGVDFRQLPEADASVDVVIFDPPYITTGVATQPETQRLHDAFGLVGGDYSISDLKELFAAGMKEATRVLKPKGRLFVKCMDFVTSGRLVLAHHHVVTTALGLGLEQVDEFIHNAGTGPQPEGRRQVHSRRAHSFLCIFQMPRKGARIDGCEVPDGT
jgi:hypothetical protein